MFKKILWSVVVVFSFIFSQSMLADSAGCDGLKQMLANLKLDEAQQAKIKPIMDQLKSSTKDAWSQMSDLDKQIKQQVNSDKMDASSLNSLVDQKTKIIGDVMKAKLSAQNQVMAVLTAQQKAVVQTKLQALEDRIAAKLKSCHDQD